MRMEIYLLQESAAAKGAITIGVRETIVAVAEADEIIINIKLRMW